MCVAHTVTECGVRWPLPSCTAHKGGGVKVCHLTVVTEVFVCSVVLHQRTAPANIVPCIAAEMSTLVPGSDLPGW